MQEKKVWLNGKIVEGKDAKTHILTNALHYGNSVFEGIRCYKTSKGSAIFRHQDHVKRLLNSSHILGMKIKYDESEIMKAIKEIITANNLNECYIRPIIYADEGGFDLIMDHAKISVAIAVWEWKQYLGKEALDNGIRAIVSSFIRPHVNATMVKAKTGGNYVNSTLARTEAARLGFDEAIMLDTNGFVSECTGENIFLVLDNVIYTPPKSTILAGITRESIIKIAIELGYVLREENISRDQLYIADEVFVTGTAAEIVGIREIDHRQIGYGTTGKITKKLQSTFSDIVRGNNNKYRKWLDYVE